MENLWDHIAVGDFVAASIQGRGSKTVIGKVLQISDTNFEINYWKGSIKRKWTPWLTSEK